MKKASFRINSLLMLMVTATALVSLSCTKNKSQKFASAPETPVVISPSCGAIDMSPPNNLYSNKMVNFEIIPPTGTTLENIQWNFLKGSTNVLSTTTTTVSHMFNGANEGAGSYVAKATFVKSDGNSCALEKAFQILAHDVCVPPTGISGPTIGYVNEETSPFSVNAEPCFQGEILWDMNNDGITEYTLAPDAFTSHTYAQTGTYTVRAIAINFEDDNQQPAFFHTIDIRNKSCINPFTNAVIPHGETVEFSKQSEQCGGRPCDTTRRACINGEFETGGNTGTFTENPATCPISPSCPATYAWEASQFGACTGACASSVGTKPITDYICKKTVDGNVTTAPDAECVSGIGAKPTGQTQSCTVSPENQNLNCLSCGEVPHGGSVTQWAPNSKCGSTCNSQSRNCNNGVILPFDPNYTYPTQESCPIAECHTYSWDVGDYGACSATACGTQGTQTRSVTCVRDDGATVADSFCATAKPSTTKTCSARPCNSCALPWDGTLAHDDTVNAFQKPSVTYGNQCVSETRKCTDGTLSGSYTYKSCKADEPANCSLHGVTVLHGQSRDFFFASSVSCAQSCSSISRTCNNGDLSGNASYNKPTCNAATCGYSWTIGEFGSCSAVACGTQGVKTRSVTCTRSDGATVADSFCSSPKPATTQSCSAPACPPVQFATSTCGFGLVSSNWVGEAGQPTSTYNGCEWGGSIYLGSSNKVNANFFFGDYYDTSGPYGIWRLNNPTQWTISGTGCTFGTIIDPKNHQKTMPNYCKVQTYSRYYGTPLIWNATITAKNNVTGEVRVLPIRATFKPTIRPRP